MKQALVKLFPCLILLFALVVSPQNMIAKEARTELNFNDVEVLSILKLMSKVTGKSFVFNAKDLKGKKITLLSDERFSAEEAYQVFEAVLSMNDISTIEEGKVVKIIPSKDARVETTPIYDPDKKYRFGSYVTRIFRVKYGNARTLRANLNPLVSKNGYLINIDEGNFLILRDTRENTDRFGQILDAVDLESAGTEIKLYFLQHADAGKVVGVIGKIVSGIDSAEGTTRKTILTSDDRTNTLIVVYSNPRVLEVIEKVLKDIDRPDADVVLELIQIEFAEAGELAALITKVFPPKKQATNENISAYFDKRTNNLILIGPPESLAKVKELVKALDVKMNPEDVAEERGNIWVRPLKNANAKSVSEVLGKVAKTFNKKDDKGKELVNTTIIPDIPTNSLVIFADQESFPAIDKVIKDLDIPRPQVFIQALIMEMKLDKSLNLGIQWQGGNIINKGTDKEGYVSVGGVGSTGGPKTVETAISEGSGSVIGMVGSPIQFGGNSYTTFNAFIKAAQKDSEIDILANPQILTLNHEDAEIKVGEIIPTVGSTKVDTNGQTTTTIDYKEVGITLKISPQINSDDSIELQIDETSSNVIEGKIGAFDQGAITTLNRSLKTKVVVDNGRTIALGGLISDEVTVETHRTPCLGDIPVLGWLFKAETTSTRKTNLLIFLTPQIIRTQEDLRKLSAERTEKIRNARQGRFRIDVSKEYNVPDIAKTAPGPEDEEQMEKKPAEE